MKGKVVVGILVLCCVGLTVGLVLFRKRAEEEKLAFQDKVTLLSTNLVQTSALLEEQKRVNSTLENTLATRTAELLSTSGRLESVKVDLSDAQAKAQAEAAAAAAELKKRDARINELEGRNEDLTKKMTDLNSAIGELEKQIAETERKLAASEGDREFLLAELKRLQGEKADLERQFNDLALLRDQIRKLRDELSIARRLEWIRRGLYGSETKGTEKLQPGFATPAGQSAADLNVEIRQDGGARVVPATNAPAETPK